VESPKRWEDHLREQFMARAIPFLRNPLPAGTLQWLYLMRHHGVPTRLLDWTEASLVGIHFGASIARSAPAEVDGCVWLLNHTWLRNAAYGDAGWLGTIDAIVEAGVLQDHVPAPIRPPHINARISAQRSSFTVHGIVPDAFGRARKQPGGNDVLARIEIPADAKETIRHQLCEAGFTESVLFPDLDGLGRELAAAILPDLIDGITY
jgi:hypothetical protein